MSKTASKAASKTAAPKTEQPNTEPAQAPAQAAKDDGLVPMTKGGQTLRVHPSCVADHQRCGWSLVGHADIPLPPQPEPPVA